MVCEELGGLQGVFAVAGHTDMEGFQSQIQNVAVHGGRDGAQVTHELSGALGDKGSGLTELFGVGDAVVALVRGGKTGELVGVSHPVELAAVYDDTAHGGVVAVHVLGGGVGHNVRPPLDGLAVDGGGEGVVDDQRYAVGVGGSGEALDIQHDQGGVGDALTEHHLGVGAEGGLQLLIGTVGIHKGALNTHALHGDGEEVERAAVDGGRGDNVVSGGAEVEGGEEVCSLTGGGQNSGGAALQRRDLGGHCVVGGVGKAGIEVAALLQIEQRTHAGGGIIFKCGALNDGDHAGLAVLGGVTGLNAVCLLFPVLAHGKTLLVF